MKNCYNCLHEYHCRKSGKVDACGDWKPEPGKEKDMKKLFISCPMKGRTEENIRKSIEKMHKMAEIIFDQELELIQTYIEDTPPEDAQQAVWYLGKSIELMAGADYFIGIQYTEYFKGCNCEAQVARTYGIRTTFVDIYEMMPDACEIERGSYADLVKSCAPCQG